MGGTSGLTLSAPIGIEIEGGRFEELLPSGASLPERATSTLTTAEDDQTEISLRVFQGDDEVAQENDYLGECSVTGVPPVPAGEPDIEVHMFAEEDGTVHLLAREQGTDNFGVEITGQDDLDDATVVDSDGSEVPSGPEPVLAVDLGTTNSRCAVFDGSGPEIVPNSNGSRVTPTALSVDESGERLVGKQAKKRAVSHPSRTVTRLKNVLSEPDRTIELAGKEYEPEQIVARFLETLKSDAEAHLDRPIEKAVVAVPTSSTVRQRHLLRRAGDMAGLSIERTIDDTAAAAMAYGLDDDSDETVLVYDLGGGTFDVSILKLGGGVYEIVATTGDNDLGGEDWTDEIVDHLANRFEDRHGIDLRTDSRTRARLAEAAERAKLELSSRQKTRIDVPAVATAGGERLDLSATLTRSTFESITSTLAERIVGPTSQALSEANITSDDIDEIVLVGGATRMPQIQRKIGSLLGREPTRSVHPDEGVALGTAVEAGILSGAVEDVILLDVLSHALGVEIEGDLFERIVQRNVTIPTTESKVFTTTLDGQTRVPIRVFQGDREVAEANELLAEFAVTDVSPAPAGTPQIEVVIEIDENRIVSVTASLDAGSDSIQISPSETLPVTGEHAVQTDDTEGSLRVLRGQETGEGDESDGDVAPDELPEGIVDDTLAVRNQLHRGVLYCRHSIDNEISDIVENLEKAAQQIDAIRDRAPTEASTGDNGRAENLQRSERLQAALADVSQSMAAAIDDGSVATWTIRDLESLIDDVDRGLEAAGLRLIDPAGGTETDPYRHQVVSSTESSVPNGRIVSVQRIGYERDGEIRREAKVVVSSTESTNTPETNASTTGTDERDSTARPRASVREERTPPVEEFASPARRSLNYTDLEIGEKLGAGGQAIVSAATHPDIETPDRFAVKELDRSSVTITGDRIHSFLQSAQLWMDVDSRERDSPRWTSHEYIVGVVDIGEKLSWIAMEYMDGGDLADRLDESPDGLPIEEAVWITQCLCRALMVAHEAGITHLDIKPGNVLFAETSSSHWDLPKLADWGLANKLRADTHPIDGLSRSYAAPEQFDGDDCAAPDPLTDIYQVGGVLYAMLTGRPPASGRRHATIKQNVFDEASPPPPSDARDDVPPALDDVVRTALATDRGDRYESIRYLRDDLEGLWE